MIKNLKIENFIGIKTLELDNKKNKNILVFGPNGSGKSSIADALKYIQEKENEISKIGRDSTKTLSFGDSPIDDISVALISSENETASRCAINNTEYSAESIANFIGNIQILRKDNLLSFLHASDADRYRQFLSLMNLDSLNIKLSALQGKTTELRGLLRENESDVIGKRNLTTFANLDGTRFEEIEASFLNECEAQFPDFESKDTINSLQVKFAKLVDPETKRKSEDLTKQHNLLSRGIAEDDLSVLNRLAKSCERLIELQKQTSESYLLELLQPCIHIFETQELTNCPVCEDSGSFDQNNILSKLKERMSSLQDVVNLETEIYRKASSAELRNKFGDLKEINILVGNKYESEITAAELLFNKILTKTFPNESDSIDLNAFFAKQDEKLTEIEKEINSHVGEISLLNSANEILINNKEEWLKAEALNAGLNRKIEIISKLERTLIKSRDEVINEVFAEIQDSTIELYDKLNYGESEFGNVQMRKLRKSSLQIAIGFFTGNTVDPLSALSTGHLDLFAIALFLSTINKFYPAGTLIVFEDVVTSNDNNHKRRIATTLINELQDFKLIITTHLSGFFTNLTETIAANDFHAEWLICELGEWEKETGTIFQTIGDSAVSNQARVNFLKENLTKENYLRIGGVMRILTEGFLGRMADKKRASVTYNRRHLFTAGDFTANSTIKKEIHKDLRIKLDEDQAKNLINDFFGQPSILNLLSHNNELTDETPFPEVQAFVLALEVLLALEERATFNKLA